MRPLIIEEGAVYADVSTTTGWTCTNGTLTVESPPDGSEPTLCITSSVGLAADLKRADPDFTLPNGYVIAFEVYSGVPAYYANGNARVSGFNMDDGVFNHHQWNTLTIHPNDWHTFIVPNHPTKASTTGTGCTWVNTGNRHQTFNQLWFRFREVAATQVKFWIRNVRLVKLASCVTISIDDGHASNVSMVQKFNDLGFKVGLAIISNNIGTANYLTWDQLDAIVDAGNELYCHTRTHQQNVLNQSGVSRSLIHDEVGGCIYRLDARYGKRLSHRIFVHPYGERGQTYDYGALDCGVVLGVGTIDGINAPWITLSNPASANPTYPYLSRHLVYRTTTTHVNDIAWLDHALSAGGMINLGYHRESSGIYSGNTNDLDIPPERLLQMCTDLARRQTSQPVMLLSQWYHMATKS